MTNKVNFSVGGGRSFAACLFDAELDVDFGINRGVAVLSCPDCTFGWAEAAGDFNPNTATINTETDVSGFGLAGPNNPFVETIVPMPGPGHANMSVSWEFDSVNDTYAVIGQQSHNRNGYLELGAVAYSGADSFESWSISLFDALNAAGSIEKAMQMGTLPSESLVLAALREDDLASNFAFDIDVSNLGLANNEYVVFTNLAHSVATPVPEPSTILTSILAGIVFAACCRHRRSVICR